MAAALLIEQSQRTCQLIVHEVEQFQIDQLPELDSNNACQLIVVEVELFQIGQLPELDRN